MTHSMKDAERLCDMRELLTRKAETGLDALDMEHSSLQDVQGMGIVVDMIHHLAEAENNIRQAEYYETVVKAMEDADEDDKREWRKRHGMMDQPVMLPREVHGRVLHMPGMDDMRGMGGKHETEAHRTPSEQFDEMMSRLSEVWQTADPNLRKRMKTDLTTKINAM